MNKFLGSDWLKAVQFFLTKCKKAKQSARILSKISPKLQKKTTLQTLP